MQFCGYYKQDMSVSRNGLDMIANLEDRDEISVIAKIVVFMILLLNLAHFIVILCMGMITVIMEEGKMTNECKTCRFWFLNRCYWNHLVNNSDCDDWEYKRIYPVRETWVKED
jgi:hypothetical protein